jgi:hypothetical protein
MGHKREALDVIAGRCLITGLSLPLAETSAAGLLVLPVHQGSQLLVEEFLIL